MITYPIQKNFMKNFNQQRRARQARLAIVQALYQAHQSKTPLKEVANQFLERNAPELGLNTKENKELIEKLDAALFCRTIEKIINMRCNIENFIKKTLSKKRVFEKLDPLLQAILLAGGSELLIKKTPAAVIISEYVDVSHGFFEGSEPTLINGVLDTLSKNHLLIKPNKSTLIT